MSWLLKKPHPFIFNKSSVLLPAVVTFFLFLFIGPFGVADMDWSYRLLLAALFGLNGALAVIITVGGLKMIVSKSALEDQWTVGKEMLLIILVVFVICLINFGFFSFAGLADQRPADLFIQVTLKTTAISVFPVVILVLFEQFMHKRKSLQEALEITERLHQKTTIENSGADKLNFYAENEKFEISLLPEKILTLKSEGNYVEIFYLNDQVEVKKKLIRNRLKALSEILPAEQFFNSHKSYVLNKAHIESVEGNARNLNVTMSHLDFAIPVSRSKTKDFQKFLSE
ncbi:hypothetical protein GCM10027429_04140 [Marivirga atlantica]|jgi:hypothetical protein|uniref:LytTR family transcriptional regulator n=1 Tax=Marivirga atlantica TaxID=1548457 RepID=A0A937AI49_9BACT|nr:LytTR family DNA-binding domain-containing protein [Marivirga atlantica]MBL0764023.1 LytTR family transcriptional regulator [Marivirga atlantica]